MEQEIWKDIPGYEGLYEVSTFGRVRSKDKLIELDWTKNRHVSMNYFSYVKKGRMMKLRHNPHGYVVVGLTKDKKQKGYMVHRLVMLAHYPEHEADQLFINHKDENKENNHISNLEWCTAKYNSNYGTCIERSRSKQMYTNSRRRPVISIDKEGNEIEYLSAWDASRKVGAFQSNIWKAVNKGGTCAGYKWKYKYDTIESCG